MGKVNVDLIWTLLLVSGAPSGGQMGSLVAGVWADSAAQVGVTLCCVGENWYRVGADL